MVILKNLKLSETVNIILSMLCSAIPPILATRARNCINGDTSREVAIQFSSYIVASLMFIILHNVLPKIMPYFRPLRKYEGKWLQIIPGSTERPFSVITFSFRQERGGYYLCGTNYSVDRKTEICFDANKFVETSTKNGFYYITNTTSEYKNGLGKISFIDSNHDHLSRAIGYFFDAGNNSCSKKYNTFLIKCDKKFFKSLGPQYSNINIKKLKHNDIMELSKNFAQNELNKYTDEQSSLSAP